MINPVTLEDEADALARSMGNTFVNHLPDLAPIDDPLTSIGAFGVGLHAAPQQQHILLQQQQQQQQQHQQQSAQPQAATQRMQTRAQTRSAATQPQPMDT